MKRIGSHGDRVHKAWHGMGRRRRESQVSTQKSGEKTAEKEVSVDKEESKWTAEVDWKMISHGGKIILIKSWDQTRMRSGSLITNI
ncbi:hypothetical protein V6N12_045315 [Hibiscus sabdariffa]|uniref:Uncharacterized protein n=1 Tax=Hibiscus sabdariffa TaxID=183260 RepID=A0ABR2G2G6_9ROSI